MENLNPTELATSSFGQGVTTSMIQMAAGFCSVINGGNYYAPHVVKRLLDSDGNVVEDIDPVLVRKTISKEVSDYMRTYLQAVVEEGTGYAAGIDGYTIGGKTGTATGEGGATTHGWFAGYFELDNKLYTLVIVAPNINGVDENGTELAGGNTAAPIYREIIKALISE